MIATRSSRPFVLPRHRGRSLGRTARSPLSEAYWFMSVRIYVGNLNFKTSDQEIRDAFAAHGEVEEVFIASDRETGRPRGFGFVTMRDAKEAQSAIEQLNGADLGGRNIVVNEARPRETQGGGGGGGGGRGGGYKGGGRGGRHRDSW